MNGRNAKTITLAEGLSLATSPVVGLPSGTPSIIGMGGSCQLIIKRTGGSSVTLLIDEYFNTETDFIPKCEDSGTTTGLLSRQSTESNFSFAFSTLAEKLRFSLIGGSGTEVVDVYLVVGEIV